MGLQAWIVTIWHACAVLIRPINNHWKITINGALMVLFLFVLRSHYNTDFGTKEVAELLFDVVRWWCFFIQEKLRKSKLGSKMSVVSFRYQKIYIFPRSLGSCTSISAQRRCILLHLFTAPFFFFNIFCLQLIVLQVRMPLVKHTLS